MVCIATSYEAAGVYSAASVAMVSLIIFLVIKQICSASGNPRLKDLSRNLDLAVAPLFVVFAAVWVAKFQSSI